MAFIQGTQVFTNTGWKKIEDIAGQDKVLVRNFIGDAEFIQPFALKRRDYEGEIVKIGARNWSFSVTPGHIVVYDRDDKPVGANFKYVPAEEMEVNPDNRIYRKFKFIAPDTYKSEKIIIYNEFGKSWVTISDKDWFTLVGYILCKGRLVKQNGGKYALFLFLNEDKSDEELKLLGDILDRMNVKWSLIKSDRWCIRVSVSNSLASRIAFRLGSKKRRQMYLPDKMIYNCTKELADTLIESLINASIRADTERKKEYQFTTTSKKLAEGLLLLGTLWGYGVTSTISARKGDKSDYGEIKNDVYKLHITEATKTYSPTYVKKDTYNGKVYEIDLFDGQVYVKENGMPVWVNPK